MAAKDKDFRAQIREASTYRRAYGVLADAVVEGRRRAVVGVSWNPVTKKMEIEYDEENKIGNPAPDKTEPRS